MDEALIGRHGTFEAGLADRYRFEAELGRGAMGVVYRARDIRLGRPVAIKMLHPALTNELGVARFESEIRIAASLHHPNIITVHESGEVDGQLYYVMDYLGGETLRARLAREKQLSVEDALRIAESIAEGLQYAHDHGVVHRDIKPENILLVEGRACIVDFGLARVLSDVDTQRLTASGLSVGTPHYLSPEQAAAERDVGPKADQYALACVLFEMLVGEPPFTGPTASAIAMRHIAEPAPPMRVRRKTAWPSIEAAVLRAMEKVPADRFKSLHEFTDACRTGGSDRQESGSTGVAAPRRLVGGQRRVAIVGFAVLLFTGVAVARSESSAADLFDDSVRFVTRTPLDTSRYVVLRFATPDIETRTLNAHVRLGDAIARWDGVSVPSVLQTQSALGSRASDSLSHRLARSVARSLNAGRYVIGTVSREGDAYRVRAELYGVRRGMMRSSSFLTDTSSARADSGFARLAYSIVFNSDVRTQSVAAIYGTRNRAALAGYLRAIAAMREWALPTADSALSDALRYDPTFPNALLALAQVRSWMAVNSAELVGLANRALDRSSQLSPSERAHATAIRDLESERYAEACTQYNSLIATDSLDFAAWYGLAECSRRDPVVIPDSRFPSRKSYRSSLRLAVYAIDRAFDLLPRLHACCVARVGDILRTYFLFTSNTHLRFGRGLGTDSLVYLAYPEMSGDTLAFIPHPAQLSTQAPPPTYTAAVDQQRRAFFASASKRLSLAPRSPYSLELLGEAMDLLGDPFAVDTIRRARTLVSNNGDALRLAVREAWLRIKHALPHNADELRSVRIFAESILKNTRPVSPRDAAQLASLAAVVGDADKAAALSRRIDDADRQPGLPVGVHGTARALLVYAAMGGPVDSLRFLESRLSDDINSEVLLRDRAFNRTMWLTRGAALGFPAYRDIDFSRLDTTYALLSAEFAFTKGNKDQARKRLSDASRARGDVRPADITLDALYPEAWLLAAVGDTVRALATLGPTLDALRAIPARQLTDAVIAGSLMQSMLLRARLLNRTGSLESGQAWARAVAALMDTTLISSRQKPALTSQPNR